jgi:uncharacterized protein
MTSGVSLFVQINPTERVDKVVSSAEKIFPGLTMDIREDRIEAYGGIEALMTLHNMLRDQQILDTARSVILDGQIGKTFQFRLNKQAAFMGIINFPPEEEPLGSIHVQIACEDRLLDWLAPKTENGIPVDEIDFEDLKSEDTGSTEMRSGKENLPEEDV